MTTTHQSPYSVAYAKPETFEAWSTKTHLTTSYEDHDNSDTQSIASDISDNDESYVERFKYTCMIIGIYVKSIFRFLKNTFTKNRKAEDDYNSDCFPSISAHETKNEGSSFDNVIEYRLRIVNDRLKNMYSLPYGVWDLESGVELVNLCHTRYEISFYNK